MTIAHWSWLGRISFDRAAALQERLRQQILGGERASTLLLCEHDPVITLGRSAHAGHILASPAELERRQIAVRRASRGGDVTYHGPGQLVGYPVFRLGRGLVAHMETMARAVAAVLAQLDIHAVWRRDRPGLWVGEDKICAFGVHVHRRVTIHGFALNATTPPEAFSTIVPCGLAGARVTSIAELRDRVPSLPELASATAAAFAEAFALDLRAPREPEAEAGRPPRRK
jgi:lipoyl(octanoyl) transferase